jgi:transposase
MSKKQHIVSFTDKENAYLLSYLTTGVHSARSIKRAQILRLAHMNKSDPQIAEQLGLCKATVYNIRRRYCTEGLEAALQEKPRPGAPKKFDGRQEARFTAIACSDPPMGRQRWTLRLLTDKVVDLELVESISPATVRTWLKKTHSTPGRSVNGASASSAASSSC